MKKSISLKGIDIQALIGVGDANLRVLEDHFASQIIVRGNEFHIDGENNEVEAIGHLVHEMSQTLNRKGSLTQKNIQDLIRITCNEDKTQNNKSVDNVIYYGRKGGITARTEGQEKYVVNHVNEFQELKIDVKMQLIFALLLFLFHLKLKKIVLFK